MQIIRYLSHVNMQRPCVIAIGNFDGLHRGHQALLGQLKILARQQSAVSTVILFEPQPLEYFQSEQVPTRLLTLREKLKHLEQWGIEQVIILKFNQALAQLSATDFIQTILHQTLQACCIIVGEDFRFGYQRQGHVALLRKQCQQFACVVHTADTLFHHGKRVSSTWVRQALKEGDLILAEQLLAYPYVLSGRVRIGDQRGRQWGFPTANIHLKRQQVPLQGVFAVQIDGLTQQRFNGVANIGTRPTVDGTRTLLEVHIFDFDTTIYHQRIHVICCKKLRDEQRFASFGLLKQQIAQDVMMAKHYFAKH